MTTFDTGNPVGSTEVKDLYDNAQNLDELVNNRAARSYDDRLGVARKTWWGMEQDFQDFLINSGYQNIGDYAAGLEITARNQVFWKDGELYRAGAVLELPYTTTGDWIEEEALFVAVGDQVLRQQLADQDSGAGMIGYNGATLPEYLASESQRIDDIHSDLSNDIDPAKGAAQVGYRGRTVFDRLSETVSATDHGALYNGSDETAKLQAAINRAIASGVRYVHIDGPMLINGSLTNRSNVVFIGKGSLSGVGAYRRHVYPRRSAALRLSGVNPVRHLTAFGAAAAPVVAFMGDSLMTYQPNTMALGSLLVSQLERKIRKDNPAKTITFHNRAIGGQHWTTANSKPSSVDQATYAWYTDTNRDWLLYLQDLAPDLIVFGFGMNDTSNFSYAHLKAVIAKVKAWAKVPSIVICTNLVPSLEADPSIAAGISDKAGQEGRDFVAGYQRSYAERNGFGVIDCNRVGNIIRDGFDLRESCTRVTVSGLDVSTTGYFQGDTECRDCFIAATITGSASQIAAKYANASPMAFQLSSISANSVFLQTVTGRIYLNFYENSGSNYVAVDTGISIPTVPHLLQLEVRDTSFSFQVFNLAGVRIGSPTFVGNIIRYGGLFLPRLSYFGTLTGPSGTITSGVGEHTLYEPSRLNNELWGNPSPAIDTKTPYGGNGLNHPSSIGATEIYGPAIDGSNFAA